MLKNKDTLTSILLGYSVCLFQGKKTFIKHFGPIDRIETDYHYDLGYQQALDKGVLTEAQKLKFLNERGTWTDKDEADLAALKREIQNKKKFKKTLPLPSQIEEMNKEISEREIKLSQLNKRRFGLLNVTAESIAAKRSEDYYIYNSFYSDKNFECPLLKESFDELDYDTMDELKLVYLDRIGPMADIRKIALQKEFMDFLHLDEDTYRILGKPYVQYTFFQIDLMYFGRFYKAILNSDPKPPIDIQDNPEKLEDWYSRSSNSKKLNKGKSQNQNIALVGAKDSDLKQLYGNDPNVTSLDAEIVKAAEKSGKQVLNAHDIMKMGF